MLARLGAAGIVVRVPEDLENAGSIIIPGGESTTMSLLLNSSGLLEPLQHRLTAGMPAFGTCAGMILLARDVLDGKAGQVKLGAIDIAVRRNAFGRQRDSFEADLDVRWPAVSGHGNGDGNGRGALARAGNGASAQQPVHAVFIRAPLVEQAGPAVEVLASVATAAGPRPVICRQGPVLVSAFHPELVGEVRLHELFLQYHQASSTRKENVRAL